VDLDQSYGRAPQLSDYLGVLKARRSTIAAMTMIGLLLAGLYLATRSPSYSSTAEVQINLSSDPTGGLGTDLLTEVAVADSSKVAEEALRSLPGSALGTQDLLTKVTVSTPSEAAVLVITCVDQEAGFAQACADAMANGYLTYKDQTASQAAESTRIALQDQLAAITERLAQISDEQATLEASGDTSSPDYQALDVERISLIAEQNAISADLTDLDRRDPAGSVLSSASPATSTAPGAAIVLIAGALFGLFFGVVLAFVQEALSGRVREASDVERELGAPVVGVVPITKKERSQVVSRDFPGEPAAEAYRLLRSGLLFAAKGQHRVVMVTSAGVGDGKSTTAANVAVALAQAGHQTILVGGDLRRPDLHTLFDVPNSEGLVQVLALGADPALLPTGVDRLRLLTSGPPAEQSAHLFETDAFPSLMRELRDQAEFVVVDAPPLAISDPLLMAPSIDMVLFVVDAGKATRRSLHRTRELLERIGLPQMGVALNKYRGHWAPSGGSGAYYYRRSKDEPIETSPSAAARTASPTKASQPTTSTATGSPATTSPAKAPEERTSGTDAEPDTNGEATTQRQTSRTGRRGGRSGG
jgi:capsular exopolysaccharide synthesis family protein